MNRKDRRFQESLVRRGLSKEMFDWEIKNQQKTAPKSSPLVAMWKRIIAGLNRPSSYGMHIPKSKRPMVLTRVIKVSPSGKENHLAVVNHLKSEKMRTRLAKKAGRA